MAEQIEQRLLWVDLRQNDESKRWIREKYLPGHRQWIEEVEKSGKVIMHGHLMDGSGGIIIFNLDSIEEAEEISSNDPIVAHGFQKSNFKQCNFRFVKVTLSPG